MAIETVRNLPVGHGDVSFIMQQTGISAPFICTMSFNFTSQPTVTNMNYLHQQWGDHLMPLVHAGISLVRVHAFYKLDASNDTVHDSTSAAVPGTGGIATTGTAPHTALLIRKHTALAGRRNVGRMYLPGVTEEDIDQAGSVNSTYLAAAETAVDAFFGLITQYNPEIVHSKQYDPEEEAVPPTPPAPTPITSLSVDNFCATQRRRLKR